MKLANINYNTYFWWRNLCWVWKKKIHSIGFSTFKFPASAKNVYD